MNIFYYYKISKIERTISEVFFTYGSAYTRYLPMLRQVLFSELEVTSFNVMVKNSREVLISVYVEKELYVYLCNLEKKEFKFLREDKKC